VTCPIQLQPIWSPVRSIELWWKVQQENKQGTVQKLPALAFFACSVRIQKAGDLVAAACAIAECGGPLASLEDHGSDRALSTTTRNIVQRYFSLVGERVASLVRQSYEYATSISHWWLNVVRTFGFIWIDHCFLLSQFCQWNL
jgi:hypothetical protein